jgi:acetate kinase
VLGRVDAVAFTAGVGENAAPVREAAVAGLEELGLAVDGELNSVRSDEPRLISPEYARVAVAVVPTDEELEIARQTYAPEEPGPSSRPQRGLSAPPAHL